MKKLHIVGAKCKIIKTWIDCFLLWGLGNQIISYVEIIITNEIRYMKLIDLSVMIKSQYK